MHSFVCCIQMDPQMCIWRSTRLCCWLTFSARCNRNAAKNWSECMRQRRRLRLHTNSMHCKWARAAHTHTRAWSVFKMMHCMSRSSQNSTAKPQIGSLCEYYVHSCHDSVRSFVSCVPHSIRLILSTERDFVLLRCTSSVFLDNICLQLVGYWYCGRCWFRLFMFRSVYLIGTQRMVFFSFSSSIRALSPYIILFLSLFPSRSYHFTSNFASFFFFARKLLAT